MNTTQSINNEDLTYLLEHIDILKKLITTYEENVFILHPRIYSKDNTYSIKSIKVNDQVYNQFTQMWEDRFSYLKLQDLLSQCIIEFVERHASSANL